MTMNWTNRGIFDSVANYAEEPKKKKKKPKKSQKKTLVAAVNFFQDSVLTNECSSLGNRATTLMIVACRYDMTSMILGCSDMGMVSVLL